jgi:hypothetical protein
VEEEHSKSMPRRRREPPYDPVKGDTRSIRARREEDYLYHDRSFQNGLMVKRYEASTEFLRRIPTDPFPEMGEFGDLSLTIGQSTLRSHYNRTVTNIADAVGRTAVMGWEEDIDWDEALDSAVRLGLSELNNAILLACDNGQDDEDEEDEDEEDDEDDDL